MKRGGYISKQLSDHNARQNHKRFMNKGICKKAINGVEIIYIKSRQTELGLEHEARQSDSGSYY